MADLDKLSHLSSLSRRNTYVTNAFDIISPSIKKQLKEYEYNSDSGANSDHNNVVELSDEDSEGSDTSENPEDSEHLKSNAYSYVPKEYQTHTFSDEDSHGQEDSENPYRSNSNEEDNLIQVPPLNLENMNDNYKSKFKNKSNHQTDSSYLNQVFTSLEKNLSDVRIDYQASLSNSALESSARRKNCRLSHSNSNTNNDYRNNTHTSSSSNTHSSTTTSNNKDNKQNIQVHSITNSTYKGSKEFDLNKWLDELPEGLRNFIEIESSSRDQKYQRTLSYSGNTAQPRHNLRSMGSRNQYLHNITSPLKRQILESSSSDDTDDNEHEDDTHDHQEEQSYINIIKKDYIQPIKEVFNEDLKEELKNDLTNLKKGIVDLYNKSPKILQDFVKSSKSFSKFGSSETLEFVQKLKDSDEDDDDDNEPDSKRDRDTKTRNDLNLYYLETNRNNGYSYNLNKTSKTHGQFNYDDEFSQNDKETILKPIKDVDSVEQNPDNCKVYNIFDKYECFDITDQPKLTHVSSFDIKRNNLNLDLNTNRSSKKNNKDFDEDEDDDDSDEDEKVIKSIGEYNIGFLSNLSRVNEKYQLLGNYHVNSNLIKPWFLNPINEKLQSQVMCDQTQSESDRFNRNKEDKNYVINSKNNDENIKYIINKENEKIKYLIDGTNEEPPNKDVKNKDQEKYINLYQLENYYNDVDFDPNESDRNKFYDPILHFKNYEDKKKKSINHTDWATFGRPLVKRIH